MKASGPYTFGSPNPLRYSRPRRAVAAGLLGMVSVDASNASVERVR
ncbi:MAG: hypothetical protein WD066_07780 [Planctomycetaceae bacterium]